MFAGSSKPRLKFHFDIVYTQFCSTTVSPGWWRRKVENTAIKRSTVLPDVNLYAQITHTFTSKFTHNFAMRQSRQVISFQHFNFGADPNIYPKKVYLLSSYLHTYFILFVSCVVFGVINEY